MTPGRRRVLIGAGAMMAAPALGLPLTASLPPTPGLAADGANGHRPLPFALPDYRRPPPTGRRVFAHWHVFSRSPDNAPPDRDYYARKMRRVRGEVDGREQDRPFGPLIQARPLPREPLPGEDWSVRDMMFDIEAAHHIGIDGFIFNLGSFVDPAHRLWRNLEDMLEASARLGLDFSIVLSFDGATTLLHDHSPAELACIVDRVRGHPGIGRMPDGRLMLGAYRPDTWSAAQWRAFFGELHDRGEAVFFMPVFLNIRRADAEVVALADLAGDWSGDRFAAFPVQAEHRAEARARGQAFMYPVWPQDVRPALGWFTEAANSLLFRTGWQEAGRVGAEAVHIVTWNDYTEMSQIAPSSGIRHGFYDLAAYHIPLFKFGRAPVIRRDALYWFHRIEIVGQAGYGRRQPRPYELRFGSEIRNEVELVAFLTQPGRIEIETAAGRAAAEVPAGLSTLRAPLTLGRPRFRLLRDGQIVLDAVSKDEVRPTSDFQDVTYKAGSVMAG